jgi:hypothetical protein
MHLPQFGTNLNIRSRQKLSSCSQNHATIFEHCTIFWHSALSLGITMHMDGENMFRPQNVLARDQVSNIDDIAY